MLQEKGPDGRKILDALLPEMAEDYIKCYVAILSLDENADPDFGRLKLFGEQIHTRFCSAVMEMISYDIKAWDSKYEEYMRRYLGDEFADYHSAMLMEMQFYDIYRPVNENISDELVSELPAINACIAVQSCWLLMHHIGRLADAYFEEPEQLTQSSQEKDDFGALAGEIARIGLMTILITSSTQALTLNRVKKVSSREQASGNKRKESMTWLESVILVDKTAKRILRNAIEAYGSARKYESKEDSDHPGRYFLNRHALAAKIEEEIVKTAPLRQATALAGGTTKERHGGVETAESEERAGHEAEPSKQAEGMPPAKGVPKSQAVVPRPDTWGARQIERYLSKDLYGDDLTVHEVLDHSVQWHLHRMSVKRREKSPQSGV